MSGLCKYVHKYEVCFEIQSGHTTGKIDRIFFKQMQSGKTIKRDTTKA